MLTNPLELLQEKQFVATNSDKFPTAKPELFVPASVQPVDPIDAAVAMHSLTEIDVIGIDALGVPTNAKFSNSPTPPPDTSIPETPALNVNTLLSFLTVHDVPDKLKAPDPGANVKVVPLLLKTAAIALSVKDGTFVVEYAKI